MDASLRVILVLVAFLILAGILWDIFRSKERGLRRKTQKEPKWGKRPFKSIDSKSNLVLETGSNLELAPKINKQEEEPSTLLAPEDVVVLMVMARQPGVFSGKKLLEAFNELHLYYGELEIFHRHENADGSGKPLFSVASAIEPGFFDLAKMDTWATPGLTLFFSPKHRNQSIAAFELMLRIAKLLAQRLNGELRDQDRRPLTLASVEKYRERVRRPHVESNASLL